MQSLKRMIRCVLRIFDFNHEMYGCVDHEAWQYWSHLHRHAGRH